MTVNERLVVTGLLDRWDAAAVSRDRREMLEILAEVEVKESSSRSMTARPDSSIAPKISAPSPLCGRAIYSS
jgi:hypothetical protein